MLLRSMAPSPEDEVSIMGDTYHTKTGRRQGRQVMKHVSNEVAKERRRAVESRKQGELWIVREKRMK